MNNISIRSTHSNTSAPTSGAMIQGSDRTYLEAPLVADLPVHVEVQLHHQQAVPGSREPRRAAAVRGRHVTRPIEVSKIMVSYGNNELSVTILLVTDILERDYLGIICKVLKN